MSYSTEFIDELLQSVKLVDVMRKHGVQVRHGQGNNDFYVASWCCGKTDDDNGRIKKDKQTYKCLACGEQGNAIHFLKRYAGIDFLGAVKELAEMAGMEIPATDSAAIEAQRRKDLALKLAAEFYEAQNNLEYLLSRGISEDVLKKAHAGYAPGGRALRSHLEQHGFTKEELKEYKLINHKGLDTFFFRAMIPQYCRGKVVDLYGRAVQADAKYPHFYLYGDHVLNGIDQVDPRRVVFLFESDIDRLVCQSREIDNGVHPGGATKLSAYHVRLLKKKGVKDVAILYDGDKAGREGALLAGELLQNAGIVVRVVELPESMDPAMLLKDRTWESLQPYTQTAKDFETFKLYQLLSAYPLETIQRYIAERSVQAMNRSEH